MIFAVMRQDALAAGKRRALADRPKERNGRMIFDRQNFAESLRSLMPLSAI